MKKLNNEFQVNTYTLNDQKVGSTTVLSNNNFVAIWESDGQDGSGLGVFGQIFDNNGYKVYSEFLVNTNTTGDQFLGIYKGIDDESNTVTALNDGFAVTWMSPGQNTPNRIFGQVFNNKGSKVGKEFQANVYTGGEDNACSIASLSNDNFVITWRGTTYCGGTTYCIYAQVFMLQGSKIGLEFQVNTNIYLEQSYPVVAGMDKGKFVVAWQAFIEPSEYAAHDIIAQIFDSRGNKLGGEFTVNTYTQSDQTQACVAAFSNGNFVVSWSSLGQDGSDWGVYAQVFDYNGNRIGTEISVNTYTVGFQGESAVTALLKEEYFVITWQSYGQDGSGYGIYGQLFNSLGKKLDNEFQVNNYTKNDQTYSSISKLDNEGKFVALWQSDGQDGSGYGMYAQIFDAEITKYDPPTPINWPMIFTIVGGVSSLMTISYTLYQCHTDGAYCFGWNCLHGDYQAIPDHE